MRPHLGQSPQTKIVVLLAELGRLSSYSLGGLCATGGWVGRLILFKGCLIFSSREDPLYGDGPHKGTRNVTGYGEAPHGAGAKGRPVRVPPAWCVQNTPRGLQGDDLISSSSNLGQLPKTKIVVFLAFLGNLSSYALGGLCATGGWVGRLIYFKGSVIFSCREDPLYGDGPRTGTRNLTG